MIELEKSTNLNKEESIYNSILFPIYNLWDKFHCSGQTPIALSSIIILYSYFEFISFLINEDILIFQTNNSNIIPSIIMKILHFSMFFRTETNIFIFTIASFIYNSLLLISFIFCFFKNGISKTYLYIYYFILILNYWIIFPPLLEITLSSFLVTLNKTKIFALSTISLIIQFIFLIQFCFFGHKSLLKHKFSDGLTRADANFEIYYLLQRVFVIIIIFIFKSVLNDYNAQILKLRWIIIGYYLLSSIIMIRFNYYKKLFYLTIVRLVFSTSLLFCLYMSFISILLVLYPGFNPFWISIIGISFLFFIEQHNLNYYNTNLLFYTSHSSIDNEYIIDNFLKIYEYEFSKEVNNVENRNMIVFYGLLEAHQKECPYKDCLIKNPQLYYIPYKKIFITPINYAEKSQSLKYILLLSLYNFYLSHKFSPTVLISYCNYQYDVIGNLIMVRYKIDQVDTKKCSIQQKFSIFKIKYLSNIKLAEDLFDSNSDQMEDKELIVKIISEIENKENEAFYENDKSDSNTNLKLITVIKYYNIVSKFKLLLNDAVNKSYSIWSSMLVKNNFNLIYKEGIEMFDLNLAINKTFERIKGIYWNYEIMKLYSDYQKYIIGDIIEAESIQNSVVINNITDSLKEINIKKKEFYFSHDSSLVMAQFTKDKSIITKVTESIQNLFGYLPNQILGKELEMIIPPFFQKYHSSFVNFHLKTGVRRVIGKERFLYGYHKEKYIFPVELNVMILPTNNRMSYLGCIRRINENQSVLLVEPNGKIDCLTKEALLKLKYENSFFLEKDIYIYHTCINYIKNKFLKENIDPEEFILTPNLNIRLSFCRNIVFIEQIKESLQRIFLKTSKKKLGKKKKLEELINIIEENREVANIIEIDTETTELVFNLGVNDIKKSILVMKLETSIQNNLKLDSIWSSQIEKRNMKQIKGKKKNEVEKRVVKALNQNIKNIDQTILNEKINEAGLLLKTHGNIYFQYQNFIKHIYKSTSQSMNSLSSSFHFLNYVIFTFLFGIIIFTSFIFNHSNKNINDYITYVYNNTWIEKEFQLVYDVYNKLQIKQFLLDKNEYNSYKESDDLLYNFNISTLYERYEYTFIKLYKTLSNTYNYTNQVESSLLLRLKKRISNLTYPYQIEIYNTSINSSQYASFNKKIYSKRSLYISLLSILKNINDIFLNKIINNTSLNIDKVYSYLYYSIIDNSYKLQNETIKSISLNINETFKSYYAEYILPFMISFILFIVITILYFIYLFIKLILMTRHQDSLLMSFFNIKTEEVKGQKENCKKFINLFLKTDSVINSGQSLDLNIEKRKNNISPNNKQNQNFESNKKNNDNIDIDNEKEGLTNRKNIELKSKNKNKKEKKKGNEIKEKKEKKEEKETSKNRSYWYLYIFFLSIIICYSTIIPVVIINKYISFFTYVSDNLKVYSSIKDLSFNINSNICFSQEIIIKSLLFDSTKDELSLIYNNLNNTFNSYSSLIDTFTANYSQNENIKLKFKSFMSSNICDLYNSLFIKLDNCNYIQSQNTILGYEMFLMIFEKSLFQLVKQLGNIINSNISNENIEKQLKNIINNVDYVKVVSFSNTIGFSGFDILAIILRNEFDEKKNEITENTIMFYCIIGMIIIFNHVFIWKLIRKRLIRIEIYTERIFCIFPFKILIGYPILMDYIKRIEITG